MNDEQFTFFWYGIYSQWHGSPFVFRDMNFTHAEQFMMFCKAMVFDDLETANKILASNNPKEQKKLGRGVANFNLEAWEQISKHIVYVGNYCKFSQNLSLKIKLLATKDNTLVEASPYDKIWGIGLKEDDPRALKRDTWLGENRLGEVLTQVKKDMVANVWNDNSVKMCNLIFSKYKKDNEA